MREYLIRFADRAEWIPVHIDDVDRVLTPKDMNAAAIPGWGDHRIRVGLADVSFSGEDVGWQVCIEGPMADEDAEALVGTVANQLATYCGEAIEWAAL